jgi:hypothetical protein
MTDIKQIRDTITIPAWKRLTYLTTAVGLTITFGRSSIMAWYKGQRFNDLDTLLDFLEAEEQSDDTPRSS